MDWFICNKTVWLIREKISNILSAFFIRDITRACECVTYEVFYDYKIYGSMRDKLVDYN